MTGKTLVSAVRALALASLVTGLMTFAPNANAQTQADHPSRDVPVAAGPSGAASQKIADSLGDSRTAGIYLDRDRQRFVVTVTDSKAAEAVKEAGAIPERVTYDTAYLDSIKQKLDDTFRTPGTMWGVDVPANQVVIHADSTVSDADFTELSEFIAPYGDAAHIVRIAGETTETTSPINGGDYIQNGTVACSYGFTVRSKANPEYKSILTAGHCTIEGGNDWFKSDGTYIGYTTGHYFSDGNDFGLIRAYNTSEVTYYGNVEAQNGEAQDITYSRDSALGESVCASGFTSKYGCGTVEFKNQTITYSDGHQITGMDVTSICRAGGDSGGPLFAGDAALGILSGGNSSTCFSYYQPVNEALAWYGVEVV
ncbi:S1 family peptidase [Streptomyces sp. N50]|uniref:S1 family peptidase n=1 Tax=Streptomyces sp. N50 TaxID=3081765 RepID=UPI0029625470|nr:S1 family peptidase [Streptomyces sp. N50]WOX15140.1 S1 family peptidase [Streptomyces sp. N50]